MRFLPHCVLIAAALAVVLPVSFARAEADSPPLSTVAAPLAAAPSAPTGFLQTQFPGTGAHETILSVPSFGRYAITVRSQQGTALQLVDRMAGPGDLQGIPGMRQTPVRLIWCERSTTVTPFRESFDATLDR